MQTTEFASLAAQVSALPAATPARMRQLHRLVDLEASQQAAAALHVAAERTRNDESVLAGALAAASAVLATPAADAARDQLASVVASHGFARLLPELVAELRWGASKWPDSGACVIGSALELWSWTFKEFQSGDDAAFVVDELASLVAPLLAARCLALDPDTGADEFRSDLSQVFAARTAATIGATCAELVFGYRRHMVWDAEGCGGCFETEDLDELEALIPGIACGARSSSDVIDADGTHPAKRGPCVRFDGVEPFTRMRGKLDGCLSGARIAKDRAAAAVARNTTNQGRA